MLLARTGQRTFHQKSSSTFAGSQRLRKYHRLTFPNTAQPSDPHGLTGRLSNWVSSVQLGDIPSNVVERTKYLILDGIGCAILGAQLPWSKRATDICTSMEPGGHCSLIGWDKVRLVTTLAQTGRTVSDVKSTCPPELLHYSIAHISKDSSSTMFTQKLHGTLTRSCSPPFFPPFNMIADDEGIKQMFRGLPYFSLAS